MKLRLLIVMFMSSIAIEAMGVVDLDSPIRVGTSDKLYQAKDDPKQVYAFPLALVRVGESTVAKVGDKWVAKFPVGVNPTDIAALNQSLAKSGLQNSNIRYFRANMAVIEPNSSTDIAPDFAPHLVALADPADLFGPTLYALELKKVSGFLGKDRTKKLLQTLLSDPTADHAGMIRYEFNAVFQGQPFVGRSAVSIFMGPHIATPKVGEASLAAFVQPLGTSLTGDVKILNDQASQCWNSVQPGEICLKQK